MDLGLVPQALPDPILDHEVEPKLRDESTERRFGHPRLKRLSEAAKERDVEASGVGGSDVTKESPAPDLPWEAAHSTGG